MPNLVPSRRSHSSLEDEDDSDAISQSDDGTPNGPKRARLEDGESRRTTTDSWRLETPKTVPKPNGSAHKSSSAADMRQEHQPGAIVRVSLKNFVTYTDATFFPGPSLNMIIGPNGTGKSTLVCAICLGLGWGPKHLGRAKNVEDFIKHGAKVASIEIELKGRPGMTNRIIKRNIGHEKKNNNWWINGLTSNEKSARDTAQSFNIQIDNLCQFLPQDRVVEFANLKPVDKLAATIRAAAPQEMIDQHDELKQLRVKQRDFEGQINGQKMQLTAFEAKHAAQLEDVNRVRERKQVVDEIDFLEKTKPSAEFQTAVVEFTGAKQAQTILKTDLRVLRQEEEPKLQAAREKEEYQAQVNEILKSRKTLLEGLERSATNAEKSIEGVNSKIKECYEGIGLEKKNGEARKKKIAEIKQNIVRFESSLRNAPPEFDAAAFNEQIREKRRERNDIDGKIADARTERDSCSLQITQRKEAISNTEKEIASLQSVVGQREQILAKLHPATAAGWKYIQEHREELRSQFDGEIYGPPMLECSVKDESWAHAIESLFQQNELRAFTVTTESDFNRLSNLLHKGQNGRSAIAPGTSLRQCSTPLNHFKPPVDDAEKQRLGISGWAIDHISGPDVILSMMCESKRLNSIALLAREESQEQFNSLLESNIATWSTKEKYTQTISRREYNASSTKTQLIRKGTYWVSQPVDRSAIDGLKQQIAERKDEVADIEQRSQPLKKRIDELQKQAKQLMEDEAAIRSQKDEQQAFATKFAAIPRQLEQQRTRLNDEQVEEGLVAQRIAEIGRKEAELALEKGQFVINFSKLIDSLRNTHVQFIEASIASIEANSDVNNLKAQNTDIEKRMRFLREEVTKSSVVLDKAKEKYKQKKKALEDYMNADPEYEERFNTLSDEQKNRTLEQIDAEIEGLQARLELLHAGHGDVIKEYEERAIRIECLRKAIADRDANLANVNEEITDIRSTWEPALDALIAQISETFSAFFTKIRCAGEVTIHKEGEDGKDFENWAILLKVKFREEEGLSVLDSQRQSGGERAVSTMFYLMALQSLSQAPFRVVDEINQGMDPRNERCVHEMMVDVACGTLTDVDDGGDGEGGEAIVPRIGSNGSQYFLITPKLLTGLKYKYGMKVHCINSGSHMPEDPEKLDLKKLISRARGLAKYAGHRGLQGAASVSVGA